MASAAVMACLRCVSQRLQTQARVPIGDIESALLANPCFGTTVVSRAFDFPDSSKKQNKKWGRRCVQNAIGATATPGGPGGGYPGYQNTRDRRANDRRARAKLKAPSTTIVKGMLSPIREPPLPT